MPETRVFIDLSQLCLTPFTSGIQRVAKEIVLRLIRDPALDVTLLAALPSQTAWRILPHDAFTARCKSGSGSYFGSGAPVVLTPGDIPTDAVFFDIDSAWNMPMHRGWLFPRLKARGVTVVSHLYDLIPVTEPQFFHAQTMREFLSWVTAVLQYADRIICNAEATKAALHTLCGELDIAAPACTVVPLGADFARKAADPAQTDTELLAKLPQYRYLLAVGTIEPRKNHRLLLDAVPALAKRGVKVVFAGRIGWNMDAFAKEMEKHPQNGTDFFFAQGPTDATIQALYQNALAVAFPTKNEGFGLPIVEAYLHGTPVLASDIPVLREVGGELADYFDNTSVDSLLAAVDALLADDAAYQQKRARISAYRPRTWDTAAEEMAAALRSFGRIQGKVPAGTPLAQAVIFSESNAELLQTLPYYDAHMPFIERVLVICPQRNIAALRSTWQGRLRLECIAAETLSGSAAADRFALCCQLVQQEILDDAFLLSDEHIRPLVPVTPEIFLHQNRYHIYYASTAGGITEPTRTLLANAGLPQIPYSAQQPQIIDRRLCLELLADVPPDQAEGAEFCTLYCNRAIAKYPAMFSAERAVSADLQAPDAVPNRILFLRHNPAQFAENGLFFGISEEYATETAAADSAEIIRRITMHLAGARADRAALQIYTEMFRDRFGTLPEFHLSLRDGVPVFNVPVLLYLPAGREIRMPFYCDAALREQVSFSITDESGETVLPPQTLSDGGTALLFSLPPYAFCGMLTLRCGDISANCAFSAVRAVPPVQ